MVFVNGTIPICTWMMTGGTPISGNPQIIATQTGILHSLRSWPRPGHRLRSLQSWTTARPDPVPDRHCTAQRVPPVIIHVQMGFSLTETIQLWAVPPFMEILIYVYPGVGMDVPMKHHPTKKGIFHLQHIFDGDVKWIPKKGH